MRKYTVLAELQLNVGVDIEAPNFAEAATAAQEMTSENFVECKGVYNAAECRVLGVREQAEAVIAAEPSQRNKKARKTSARKAPASKRKRSKLPERRCEECGTMMQPRCRGQRFCSAKCSRAWHNRDTNAKLKSSTPAEAKVAVKCDSCGKGFKATPGSTAHCPACGEPVTIPGCAA